MTKYKLEYIWLDGYDPVPNLRSKTKIKSFAGAPTLEDLPVWNFDGSSTQQAEGTSSDCVLQPVALFPDPARANGMLVMCEVLLPDGTPHPSNSRATIPDDPGTWFGFEQEYFLYRDGAPLGFPRGRLPGAAGRVLHRRRLQERRRRRPRDRRGAHRPLPRGRASTSRASTPRSRRASGSSRSSARARSGPRTRCGSPATCCSASASSYGVDINFHPKPLGMEHDWNGSGMHTNFSTEYLREVGGEEYFEALMAAFDEHKDAHIAVYGPDNHMRLTGLHETQAIDKFNYGVANRGASIRIPHAFVTNGYRGYLEDRRPNSLGDPYKIAGRILQTIETVPTDAADVSVDEAAAVAA